MKVILFGDNSNDGPDAITVYSNRATVVRELREMLQEDIDDYKGCCSIPGMANSEPLNEALVKFENGEYDEVGVYDDDDWTPWWIKEVEVVCQ